jgi:hypothetical protein
MRRRKMKIRHNISIPIWPQPAVWIELDPFADVAIIVIYRMCFGCVLACAGSTGCLELYFL